MLSLEKEVEVPEPYKPQSVVTAYPIDGETIFQLDTSAKRVKVCVNLFSLNSSPTFQFTMGGAIVGSNYAGHGFYTTGTSIYGWQKQTDKVPSVAASGANICMDITILFGEAVNSAHIIASNSECANVTSGHTTSPADGFHIGTFGSSVSGTIIVEEFVDV